ncbi:MAG: hypothetical protein JSW02_04975 [candidate division WOR-3 bacterium]|nr:MAG: hypothetical protein JSW02_04975 [candidate division WOR-3 bacterium]
MLNTKRLIIATIFGVLSGFICWILSASSSPTTWYFAVSTIIARTLIGFTIGISILKMKWWLHGITIGALFSLPMALQGFYVPGKEWFILIGTIVMGIIYGFFIELFTTVVFKQGAQTTAPAP